MKKEIPDIVNKLHTTQEWEEVNGRFTFTHIYYTSSGLVRKVCGYVPVTRRIFSNGTLQNRTSVRHVRWDGYGRCYSINNNNRLRRYDLHFPSDM